MVTSTLSSLVVDDAGCEGGGSRPAGMGWMERGVSQMSARMTGHCQVISISAHSAHILRGRPLIGHLLRLPFSKHILEI